jgi:hypothetical protein
MTHIEDPEVKRLRMGALEAKLQFGSAAGMWHKIVFKNIGVSNTFLRCQPHPWHKHADRSSEFARIRSINDVATQREQHDALRLVCDLFDAWHAASDAYDKVKDNE